MLAISTCWKSKAAECGDDIIKPIIDAGFKTIELEYRITEKLYHDMLPAIKREELNVSSIHNFFPLPMGLKREQASGDAFLLSSPEKDKRNRAVEYTLRTLEHAYEVGARAVVLHLGKTDVNDDFERLKEDIEDEAPDQGHGRDYGMTLLKEREKAGKKHLDAALFSLDKLWKRAEQYGIKLGVENRYRLKEFPTANELEAILERFEGSIVGYWHDMGHAFVQDLLYGFDHRELIARFAPNLVGVHLHDAEGVKDHKAPGKGKMDFGIIGEILEEDTIRVIEAGPDVTEEDLQDGVSLLAQEGVAAL